MIELSHLQEIFCRLYVDRYGVGFHHRDHAIYQNRQWLCDEISIMLEDLGHTMDLEKEASKIKKRDDKILLNIIEARKNAKPLHQSLADFFPRMKHE
jgi:hypothetical protein